MSLLLDVSLQNRALQTASCFQLLPVPGSRVYFVARDFVLGICCWFSESVSMAKSLSILVIPIAYLTSCKILLLDLVTSFGESLYDW